MLSWNLKVEGKGFRKLETQKDLLEKRNNFKRFLSCVRFQKVLNQCGDTQVLGIGLVYTHCGCSWLVSLGLHSAFLYSGMEN